MAVSFHILPRHGLVYVRYEGFADLDESMRAFAEYARHPGARPGQKQLVDLSAVTDFDLDYAKLMALQAQKAGVFAATPAETLIVYLAPTEVSRTMAHLVRRSWEPFTAVVPVIAESEAEALELLGAGNSRLSELLEEAG